MIYIPQNEKFSGGFGEPYDETANVDIQKTRSIQVGGIQARTCLNWDWGF